MRALRKKYILIVAILFLLPGCNNDSNLTDLAISNSTSSNISVHLNKENTTLKQGVSNSTKSESNNAVLKNDEKIKTSEPSSIDMNAQSNVQSEQHTLQTTSGNITEIESIYKKLYIGEMYETGYIYIEPFSVERNIINKKINFDYYPKDILFYPFSGGNDSLLASFDSFFSTYVPGIEENSSYFLQAFSEPDQYGLRYKLSNKQNVSQIGVSLFDHEITKIVMSDENKKRSYSQNEYDKALSLIEKDKKIDKSDRTLDYISLDNTIVGAQQICRISIKDTQYELLISKYLTHGFEYVAEVYVADFIQDGKVIKTYEKYNWDGPY